MNKMSEQIYYRVIVKVFHKWSVKNGYIKKPIGNLIEDIKRYEHSPAKDYDGVSLTKFQLREWGVMKFRFPSLEKFCYRDVGYIFDFKHIGDCLEQKKDTVKLIEILKNFLKGKYEKIEYIIGD